ncbi:MAG: hypothetical protein Q8K45_06960 [Rubrivivax sp.]|nr:hypothetical protein [Rubrivivax sp.]
MRRNDFLNSDAQDDKDLTAAKKVARSRGGTVVKSMADTLLLELAPTQLPEDARASPSWCYSVERETTRVPERKPQERSNARAALAAAATG